MTLDEHVFEVKHRKRTVAGRRSGPAGQDGRAEAEGQEPEGEHGGQPFRGGDGQHQGRGQAGEEDLGGGGPDHDLGEGGALDTASAHRPADGHGDVEVAGGGRLAPTELAERWAVPTLLPEMV